MRRNSPGLFKCSLALAMLFALALTLLFGGVASAATTSPSQSTLPVTVSCLYLMPATQTVLAGQPANVAAEVVCYPPASVTPSSVLSLFVTWGDGTTSQYPVCVEVCRVPPFVINTSHVYGLTASNVEDYHPIFCLGYSPEPVGSSSTCSSVEIIVVSR